MAKGTTTDRAAAPRDPGLDEIAGWCDWFIGAHRQRLLDLQLAPEQHASELAAIVAQADAIRARMTDDYQTRRPR